MRKDKLQKDLDKLHLEINQKVRKLKLGDKEKDVLELVFWTMVDTGAMWYRNLPHMTFPNTKKSRAN